MVFPIPISKNKKGTVPFNMMMIMFAMMIVVIITIMMIGFRINFDSPQGTSVNKSSHGELGLLAQGRPEAVWEFSFFYAYSLFP